MILIFVIWKYFYLKYRTHEDMHPEVHKYQGTIIRMYLGTKKYFNVMQALKNTQWMIQTGKIFSYVSYLYSG